MNNDFSPLTQNVLYCLRNDLLEDELGKSILEIYQAGVCDDHIARMFEKRMSKHKYQQAFYGTIPFKTPKLTKGDYVLGLDKNGKELRSFIQFLNAHSLTNAGSGAGKTNYSYYEILQIASHVMGMWLFDLRKREFVKLKSMLAEKGIHLFVLSGRDLRINPLQVPLGVTLSDWIARVADMLVQVFELPQRAGKLLQAKLFPLFHKYATKKNIYPTLYDLFEEIKKDKESNHQARMAILDSFKPILLSLGPKVLAYRYGWPSHELAKKHLVFELGGCSETGKNLLMNSSILPEVISRIARGISNPQMDLLIFADEAQRLCNSSDQSSVIADLIGFVRGGGIGLKFNFQSTHQLLPQIVSNTATKILGRCGSMSDYVTAGRNMGLNAEQIQWAQMNLEPGLFISQLGEGSWRYPFVFRVPLIKFPKTLPADLYDDNPFPELKTVYASEFDTWGFVPEVSTAAMKPSMFDSEQEFSFCKVVANYPMQASSTYPKLAGISSKTATNVRQQLISRGFIREHTLDSGGRGRSSILLEVLPEGTKAIMEHQEAQI